MDLRRAAQRWLQTWQRVAAHAGARAAILRHGWLRMIGAPDYQSYLAHHGAHHAGQAPMSEREYVRWYIERRYNRKGAGRCC